jgi:arsenate reductase-like glutaredoxin family protein
MLSSFQNRVLSSYEANTPIINIESSDLWFLQQSILETFKDISIYEFHQGGFLVNLKSGDRKRVDFLEILQNFDFREELSERVIVIKDLDRLLSREVNAYLKSIATKKLFKNGYDLTIISISKSFKIVEEFKTLVEIIDFPNPEREEIKDILSSFSKDMELSLSKDEIELLSYSFTDTDRTSIILKLNRMYQSRGDLLER